MCLVSIAWRAHPRWPVVVLGNRDEFHARPSLAAARWPDYPGVHGGRDARSGGGWLAASVEGRVAVVTNHRETGAMDPARRSRGALVSDFVATGALPSSELLDEYGAFHLLAADAGSLRYRSNRAPARDDLEPGVHTLSNAALGARWPKIRQLEEGLANLLDELDRDLDPEPFLELLTASTRAPDEELPDTGAGLDLERFLSPLFISGETYGTRCSTLVAFDAEGRGMLVERSYGPGGRRRGDVALDF